MYLRDVTASMARPVKELKNFEKVMLKAGEQKVVRFTLSEDDPVLQRAIEVRRRAGRVRMQIGLDSQNVQQNSFELL